MSYAYANCDQYPIAKSALPDTAPVTGPTSAGIWELHAAAKEASIMSRRWSATLSLALKSTLLAACLTTGIVLSGRPGIGTRPAWAEPQKAAPVRIILLGPPGAGKATQALRLAELYKVPAISTGQLLRTAAAADTPDGRALKQRLDKGDLISDDTVISLLKIRLKQPDTAGGWVMHGYPRTLMQALALDNMLVEAFQAVQLVVAMQVPGKTLVERLSHRLVCKTCARTYNEETNPPQAAGICDSDGGALIQRPEDQPDLAKQRVAGQEGLHEEMRAYYSSRDIFLEVDGTGDIAGVQSEINRGLKKRGR